MGNVDLFWVSLSSRLLPKHTILTCIGTNVFPPSEGPHYIKGLWISAAFCLLVAVLSLVLSLWLIYENKKMDREGMPEVQEFEDTSIARASGTHEKHRYIW